MLEKKLDSLRTGESKSEAKRAVQAIREDLEKESNAAKELPIREVESKQDPAVVGKLSFLIGRRKLKSFRNAAEKLAGKYAPYGFSLELTCGALGVLIVVALGKWLAKRQEAAAATQRPAEISK